MIFNIVTGKKWIYDRVTVTIVGATTTATYDAANHSASGYTVTISNPNYKTTDFTFSGTASATRKAAGTTNMGLSASQFTNNNTQFRDVVFVVTDGYVTINRKSVTVKADNKSKTYGAADPTFTATVTGTLGSDTLTYTLSRAAGSNVGTYTITPTGNATQGNYSVTYSTGTLTINKAAASALGLSVSGGTYTYNGTARSVSASVTVTSGTTIQYSTNGSSWSTTKPTYTNAGTYTTYVRAVNSNYETATANANVVINKAAASALGLSVTSYSGVYDGNSHTITATVTVTSGTTIQYRTSTTAAWSTTKPTRTAVGTTTVYVQAVNSNYNTATATATITINEDKLYIFKYGTGVLSGLSISESQYISITTSGIALTNFMGGLTLTAAGGVSYKRQYSKMYVELEYTAPSGSSISGEVAMHLSTPRVTCNLDIDISVTSSSTTTKQMSQNIDYMSSSTYPIPAAGNIEASLIIMATGNYSLKIKNWWLE